MDCIERLSCGAARVKLLVKRGSLFVILILTKDIRFPNPQMALAKIKTSYFLVLLALYYNGFVFRVLVVSPNKGFGYYLHKLGYGKE